MESFHSVGCVRHWKVKIKRIKQVTECDSDEGDPGMVPKVFSSVVCAAKNS